MQQQHYKTAGNVTVQFCNASCIVYHLKFVLCCAAIYLKPYSVIITYPVTTIRKGYSYRKEECMSRTSVIPATENSKHSKS